jgi:PBP1b-binding outer membrane lipoprotein LpoB
MHSFFRPFRLLVIILPLAFTACVPSSYQNKPQTNTTQMLNRPTQSQVRQVSDLPLEVYADTITVQQFRRVCDAMARDLVIQSFVTRAPHPPVITVRKLENKTNIKIDQSIFQETIRVKLIENARGLVLFRDDASYRDIVMEKARQNSGEIQVSMTDSIVKTRTVDRVHEREFDGGSLSGAYGKNEGATNIEQEERVEMVQEATVRSKVAAADYFLRGIIYQINERHANRPEEGMSYFQYQFRVVDARTGIIVWEKMLNSKMEGTYAAPRGGTGGGTTPAAVAPASWPTGQATVGNVNGNQQNNPAPPEPVSPGKTQINPASVQKQISQ